jgi:transcriptional regulator with XRE-family HTH domain
MTENVFGNWLREQRYDRGLTLKEFAKDLGISYVTLSNVELGKSTPGINALKKISASLDVDYIELRKILKGWHQPDD